MDFLHRDDCKFNLTTSISDMEPCIHHVKKYMISICLTLYLFTSGIAATYSHANDPSDSLETNQTTLITEILATDSLLSMDLNERIDYFSEHLIGSPYASSPLGEGLCGSHDKKPLFDLSSFDCMTFVEQVIALSMSNDTEQFLWNLQHIRYKYGEIDLMMRNHFVISDWIVNNSWILEDFTSEIGSHYVKKMSKSIDHGKFFKKFGITDTTRPALVNIEYIPHQNIVYITDRLRTGDIICFITRKQNLFVDHMGFFIRKNDRMFLRHASKPAKRVKDDLFINKIKTLSNQKYSAGIIILRLKPETDMYH